MPLKDGQITAHVSVMPGASRVASKLGRALIGGGVLFLSLVPVVLDHVSAALGPDRLSCTAPYRAGASDTATEAAL